MQYGSRHDRHELATRNLSNRSPSRISRVTPSWVSAQALVHSSQRVHFSRSSTSRLWAFISPWPRNSPSGIVLDRACGSRRSRCRRSIARSTSCSRDGRGTRSTMSRKSSAVIRTRSTWSRAEQVAVRTPARGQRRGSRGCRPAGRSRRSSRRGRRSSGHARRRAALRHLHEADRGPGRRRRPGRPGGRSSRRACSGSSCTRSRRKSTSCSNCASSARRPAKIGTLRRWLSMARRR